jgi:hypothetical protein
MLISDHDAPRNFITRHTTHIVCATSSTYARGRLRTAAVTNAARQRRHCVTPAATQRCRFNSFQEAFERGKTTFPSLKLSNGVCRIGVESCAHGTTASLSGPQLQKSASSPPKIYNSRKHLLPPRPISRVEKPVQRRSLVVQLLLRDGTVIKNGVAVHAFFGGSHGYQTERRSTPTVYLHTDRWSPLQPAAAARQAKGTGFGVQSIMHQQISRDVGARRNDGVFNEAGVEVDAGSIRRCVGRCFGWWRRLKCSRRVQARPRTGEGWRGCKRHLPFAPAGQRPWVWGFLV